MPGHESHFSSIVVREDVFEPILGHNIPNLDVAHNPQHQARFLDFYNNTGGITRWGLPTSEVFEECPGVLVQYYQRGVVAWKESINSPGSFTFQRVLAWDLIGGGLGGSIDQGVEPGLLNSNAGDQIGPWGHKVSNTSVEGIPIGFLDFFDAQGGVSSFGFPKTDARFDTNPSAVLARPGSNPSFIRQYFQAAVMEFHPDASPDFRVKLSLLGDTVRGVKYPGDAWQAMSVFNTATPLSVGQNLPRPA